jgi:hypothetical protein
VLALDGKPLAWARPHGQSITWLAPEARKHEPHVST